MHAAATCNGISIVDRTQTMDSCTWGLELYSGLWWNSTSAISIVVPISGFFSVCESVQVNTILDDVCSPGKHGLGGACVYNLWCAFGTSDVHLLISEGVFCALFFCASGPSKNVIGQWVWSLFSFSLDIRRW